MTLGAKIKHLRQTKQWTQAQLAVASGLKRSYISLLEIDKIPRPGVIPLVKLAQVFEVDEDVLFEAAGLKTLPDAPATETERELADLKCWLETSQSLEPEEKEMIWFIASKERPAAPRSENNTEYDMTDYWLNYFARADTGLDLFSLDIHLQILQIARMNEAIVGSRLRPYNLQPREFLILTQLLRTEPDHTRTPTEISKAALTPPGTVTKQIDALVQLGFVERWTSPHDHRSILVHLTPQGKAIVQQIIEHELAQEETQIYSFLSSPERVLLARQLRKLKQGLASQIV